MPPNALPLISASYLLGAVPFGYLVARLWKGIDIRTMGSGNIGATNVGRVCGRAAGSLVFALDVAKGLVPPLAAGWLGAPTPWIIGCALAAILGHIYTIFLRFRGGKGIATGLGAFLGVAPAVGGAAFGLFVVVLALFRYVSVASLCGALSLPIFTLLWYPHDPYRLLLSSIAAAVAVFTHRANLRRLAAGTEPKLGARRAES